MSIVPIIISFIAAALLYCGYFLWIIFKVRKVTEDEPRDNVGLLQPNDSE